MSRHANPTLIGAFVLGALTLAVVAALLLARGSWFGEKREHVMYFEGAAQGLQVGAPVMFLGVKVGSVTQIQLGLDNQGGQQRRFVVPVTVEVLPHVVRTRDNAVDLRDRATVRELVDRGLRAQLRMQSLLTGQLYVDLDFHPDKPARFVALDRGASEIPTIPTTVEALGAKFESFPMEQFLADVAAISGAIKTLANAKETQELPRRLLATLRHLESLAARLDAQSGPVLKDVRYDLAEMRKTFEAAQAALARLETAADRVGALAERSSATMQNLTRTSDELTQAATAVREAAAAASGTATTISNLTAENAPTVTHLNAALKEISRAADALRKLAETLEEQPDAIYRGKRK